LRRILPAVALPLPLTALWGITLRRGLRWLAIPTSVRRLRWLLRRIRAAILRRLALRGLAISARRTWWLARRLRLSPVWGLTILRWLAILRRLLATIRRRALHGILRCRITTRNGRRRFRALPARRDDQASAATNDHDQTNHQGDPERLVATAVVLRCGGGCR
jgi:hypothetical protein